MNKVGRLQTISVIILTKCLTDPSLARAISLCLSPNVTLVAFDNLIDNLFAFWCDKHSCPPTPFWLQNPVSIAFVMNLHPPFFLFPLPGVKFNSQWPHYEITNMSSLIWSPFSNLFAPTSNESSKKTHVSIVFPYLKIFSNSSLLIYKISPNILWLLRFTMTWPQLILILLWISWSISYAPKVITLIS